ncbi:SPOR domain-containing protein [Mucilaginibacter terrae]|uniref:SPOR domain-containing protein n=1 Tax=Mucilaginibacter terrae TaxID=1955052 RepID=UPI00363802B8
MDLSVYISELLNEHGTISIPQIGVFKQVRMRGHYNADEGKLYPPYYQTDFEFKPVDDDSLLHYITQKSKVSPNSAKYFLDRYLHNILQQAEIGEVLLGRIGWISKEGELLQFRPAPAVTANTAAFGFAPVSINAEPEPEKKLPETVAETAFVSPTEPVSLPVYSVEKTNVPTITSATGTTGSSSTLLRQQSSFNTPTSTPNTPAPTFDIPLITNQAEPKHPFYARPWFFALVAAVVVTALIIIFYPNPEGKSTKEAIALAPAPSMDSVVLKKSPGSTIVQPNTVTKTLPAETVIALPNKPLPASTEFAPEVETPPQPAKPVLVNTNNYRFALMSGAFSTEKAAERVVRRYKSIKVEAAIIKNISRSKYFKVTLGFFKTFAEGKAAKIKLIKDKHLREHDLYVETLKRKKK